MHGRAYGFLAPRIELVTMTLMCSSAALGGWLWITRGIERWKARIESVHSKAVPELQRSYKVEE